MTGENETDKEIEIILSDDEMGLPAADETPVVLSDDPKDGIEDLRRQIKEREQELESARRNEAGERARAEELERRRRVAEMKAEGHEAKALEATLTASAREYESVASTLEMEQQRAAQLESQYTTAMENGDFKTAAKIQTDMGRTAARLERLEEGKQALQDSYQRQETARAELAARQVQQQQRGVPAAIDWNAPWTPDIAESVMSTSSPQAAAWMRQNPKFFSDPGFRGQVSGAHQMALSKGIRQDTPEYFAEVESLVGISRTREDRQTMAQNTDSDKDTQSGASQTTARKSPSMNSQAAAPVRGTPQGGAGTASQTRVTLTPQERDMARQLFPKKKSTDPDPEVAYAQNREAMRRAGTLRNY